MNSRQDLDNNILNITIVEDSPTQAERLKYILETNGYHVTAAQNGREALDLVRQEKPDILISDIMMPEMDGYELCRQIKNDSKLSNVPVILLTALSDPADVIKGLECGADNFVTKPYDERALLSRIDYLRLNWRMPESTPVKMGIEITFGGRKYFITSDRLQILNLLLSTYESAVGKNRELEQTQNALRRLNEQLEQRVRERTAELVDTNQKLELEIVQRKKQERHILDLSNVLRALQGVNRLITREKDKGSLIQKSCNLLVETREFVCAWIMLFNDKGEVTEAAVTGGDEIREFHKQLKDGDYPPCVDAILNHANPLALCHNLLEEWTDCGLRDAYRENPGFISRLEYEGKVYGIASVYTPTHFILGPEEQALFSELANDIAFALYSLEKEEERKKLEKERDELLFNLTGRAKELACLYAVSSLFKDTRKTLNEILRDVVNLIPPAFQYPEITCARIVFEKETYHCPNYQDTPWTIKSDIMVSNRGAGIIQACYLEERPAADEGPFLKEERNLINSLAKEIETLAERKQLEGQFQQAQKMEAVGRLAGGVAHDFNNLLTGILGYSQFALDSLEQDSPLRSDIEEIRKAGESASTLTKQLLAFSRKQVLEPKISNLNDIVAGIEKMLRRVIGEDIELLTVLAPDLGPVKTDPTQIHQVILNLAVNARDAMPEGGKLSIETSNVELDEQYTANHAEVSPGPYIMLAVSDSGTGMDDDTRSRLFEPFFTTKEKTRGTGLGLSTVYGIVKQSGGSIWVYSELGKGTTFKIYLPRVEMMADEAPRKNEESRTLEGTETILLVEDEDMVRKFARRIMENSGYKVLEAPDGPAAIQISASYQGRINVMITDVVMPGMSGVELAEYMLGTLPELKVLFLSGYTENAVIHQGVLSPGIPFLQKPFPAKVLLQKVRELLDHSEA